MTLLNSIDIDTPLATRSFELWHADVTHLEFVVDLLVISAVGSDYSPMSGTVIGALSSSLEYPLNGSVQHQSWISSFHQVAYGFRRLLTRIRLAGLCAWKFLMVASMPISSCCRHSEAYPCLKREDCF